MRVLRRADAVVILTPRLARLLGRDGVQANRVHVIPSGVSTVLFDRPGDDPFPRIGRPRVAFVGRRAAQKGRRLPSNVPDRSAADARQLAARPSDQRLARGGELDP
jgi:hypothetical protein